MISIVFIIIGSIFAKKKREKDECVPLLERILGMFIINKNAGLIEMFGQILIACTLADKYLVMTFKYKTETRKIKNVKWTKQDIICFVLAIVLMFIGAIIESRSIIIH